MKLLNTSLFVNLSTVVNNNMSTSTTKNTHTCVTYLKDSDLTQHNMLIIGVGKKSNSSELCPKTFSASGNLTSHNMRVHTENKPYSCELCPKKFSQSNSLKKHRYTYPHWRKILFMQAVPKDIFPE